jgi:hypothetical protein
MVQAKSKPLDLGLKVGGLLVAAGVLRAGAQMFMLRMDLGLGSWLMSAGEALIAAGAVLFVAHSPGSGVSVRGKKIALGIAALVLLMIPVRLGIESIAATVCAIAWFYGDRAVRQLSPDAPLAERLAFAFGSLGAMAAVAGGAALLFLVLPVLDAGHAAAQIGILTIATLVVANVIMKVGFRQTRNAYMAGLSRQPAAQPPSR